MNDLYDGWHVVCGQKVYVKNGKIKNGSLGNGGSGAVAFVYRARKEGGWDRENEITIPAFRSGVRRGSIRLMEEK